MVDISKLKVGTKVHYRRDNAPGEEFENGVVKEIPDYSKNSARVVYNCAGDWSNFMNYTSALTQSENLYLGWK